MRRVLIVDDHKIMREGLVSLMQFESDIEVVGQAADGPAAIELAARLQPDVIIMDVNLGEGMNGVEATKRILSANPNIKVIGLSMHTDNDVATALRDAGAVAYLTKGGPSEDLIAAIRAACCRLIRATALYRTGRVGRTSCRSYADCHHANFGKYWQSGKTGQPECKKPLPQRRRLRRREHI